MIPFKGLRDFPFLALKSWREGRINRGSARETKGNKGQSLLRLYEYQHRVIVEIFKVSIGGFLTFTVILLAFALYVLVDPFTPLWMSLLIALLSGVLLYALFRTILEFRSYRRDYEEISNRLREKLVHQSRSGTASQQGQPKGAVEHRLLSALKPKEHTGWDHKSCKNCHKTIELLANVCQHCGQEQQVLLTN